MNTIKDFLNININNVIQGFTTANFKECILALVVGLILGFLFVKLSLPIPAPPVLAGVIGIVGIWLGFLLGK